MSDNYLTQTLYFKKPGPDNTESVLEHASKRAKELRIKKVVIASNSGRTIEKAHRSPVFQNRISRSWMKRRGPG